MHIADIDVIASGQHASATSLAVIDKLAGSGILLTQLIAADAGQTAVISFSDTVSVRQVFTSDPDRVSRALRMLRVDGGQAHMLDALHRAVLMLQQRSPERRKIIVVIAEKRDRSSAAGLVKVMGSLERLNAVVYWLTYSPFQQTFTMKPRTAEDRKPEAERIKHRTVRDMPGSRRQRCPWGYWT